tara:strand:+ start:822 stop:1769 length:948 start_codon:yes stop_codon:yes gene_type:complete
MEKNKTKYQLILIYIFLLISLISFEKTSIALENKIILKINNQIITSVDVFNEAKYLKALNESLNNIEDVEIINLAKTSLLREKIKAIEISRYSDVKVNKEYVDSIIKNIYTNLGFKSREEFENYLENRNININIVEQKLSNEALWNQIIYEKFHSKIKINKDEIKKEIESVKKFTTSFNLNEILFNAKKKGDRDKIFLKIEESIKKNGFENTASLFSVSDSSKTGGKIGWINESSINKEILKKIVKLNIGEYTKPIQTPAGFLVLNLVSKKEIKKTFDTEKELALRIKNLQNQQLNQYSNIYFNKIKQDIKINEK